MALLDASRPTSRQLKNRERPFASTLYSSFCSVRSLPVFYCLWSTVYALLSISLHTTHLFIEQASLPPSSLLACSCLLIHLALRSQPSSRLAFSARNIAPSVTSAESSTTQFHPRLQVEADDRMISRSGWLASHRTGAENCNETCLAVDASFRLVRCVGMSAQVLLLPRRISRKERSSLASTFVNIHSSHYNFPFFSPRFPSLPLIQLILNSQHTIDFLHSLVCPLGHTNSW